MKDQRKKLQIQAPVPLLKPKLKKKKKQKQTKRKIKQTQAMYGITSNEIYVESPGGFNRFFGSYRKIAGQLQSQCVKSGFVIQIWIHNSHLQWHWEKLCIIAGGVNIIS